MLHEPPVHRRNLALLLTASLCAAATLPTHAGAPVDSSTLPDSAPAGDPLPLAGLFAAADAPAEPVISGDPEPEAESAAERPDRVSPSESVTINLINRLVQRGILTKDDASDLIKQAEADAFSARAQANATQEAAERAAAAAQVAISTAAAGGGDGLSPASDDDVRVTYIPEIVKAQMRDQIKQEVMEQARNENWAAPRTLPDWVTRIKLFGDVRVRYENVFFSDSNDNTGAFPNFNSINTGAPFDLSGTSLPPLLNVDQDRQRFRLRVRLAAEAQLGDGFTAGLRIATGESSSPVTTNQTLGASGGNFSKYQIWLDRGFLKYEYGALPNKSLTIMAGRFDNPFFSSEIVWDDDLGFDGFALAAKYEVAKGVTPFGTIGAFPVFNTDFNFASNQTAKFKSDDKWLYAAQVGLDWKISKDFNLKIGVSYYYFENVEGELSDPFTPLTASDAGNTDTRRPSFAQKGNTYMALRDIVPNANNNFGTTQQFQYFGLATPFRELAVTWRLDYNRWEPFQLSLAGEYVKNLAFDKHKIDTIAVNNRGPDSDDNLSGFSGGDSAWLVGLKAGHAVLDKAWNWQVGLNYRYVESDAVIDGFTDSDFGSGGTNLKGYSLFGTVALSKRVALSLRWMSADEIAGPPLSVDIIQLDFSGKF